MESTVAVIMLRQYFVNYIGVLIMSVMSHIVHLQAKHSELETKLAQEMAHPSPDFYAIKELKKQKLLLKEELARLLEETHESRKDAS
jgi:hypothetical protein